MLNRKNKVVLMKAVSELKQADYSREPELGKIYDRLADGRKQFAGKIIVSASAGSRKNTYSCQCWTT